MLAEVSKVNGMRNNNTSSNPKRTASRHFGVLCSNVKCHGLTLRDGAFSKTFFWLRFFGLVIQHDLTRARVKGEALSNSVRHGEATHDRKFGVCQSVFVNGFSWLLRDFPAFGCIVSL